MKISPEHLAALECPFYLFLELSRSLFPLLSFTTTTSSLSTHKNNTLRLMSHYCFYSLCLHPCTILACDNNLASKAVLSSHTGQVGFLARCDILLFTSCARVEPRGCRVNTERKAISLVDYFAPVYRLFTRWGNAASLKACMLHARFVSNFIFGLRIAW